MDDRQGGGEPEMMLQFDVSIRLRDGVVTRADVYRPKTEGGTGKRYPVILQRTPYDKSNTTNSYMGLSPMRAVRRGYAVVIQDVRGRHRSEGDFDPLFQEINDGYDSVEWCASQPWSTGNVGMYGGSYVGATQWLAAASGAPHLRAIVPLDTASNYYEEWFYRGGALQLSFLEVWCMNEFAPTELLRRGLHRRANRLLDAADRMDELVFRHLPVGDLPYFRGASDYFYEWLAHPSEDTYWDGINVGSYHHRIKVHALNLGGWYDIFLGGTISNFMGMRESDPDQGLVVGPWAHGGRNPWHDKLVGEVDFGHKASNLAIDMEGLHLGWYDRWLKGAEKNSHRTRLPVKIFVMGENVWRDENDWPLTRTNFTNYYMRSDGSANTSGGDGRLDVEAPSSETPDRFLYDPMDPVPTVGGSVCCDSTNAPGGPYDQSDIELRKDVLVYSTPPLKRAVEATGPISMELFASSTAVDTDFTAKLVDLWPCGFAQQIACGIIRARYRGSRREARMITPGRIHGYSIDMWSSSNLFLKGHRIRLEISSSNFPQFDRNMNTGNPVSEDETPIVAVQRVFHDEKHKSRMILPIIPR
jgi:putative CocE/NonD family hydrolase